MKALKIASELQDRIGEAVVCANLGSNYEMLGDITSALEYHQKVLCDFDHYCQCYAIIYFLHGWCCNMN